MTNLEQAINDMISYHIGRNDDAQGLASELNIYITNHVDDAGQLARELQTDLAYLIASDGEDEEEAA